MKKKRVTKRKRKTKTKTKTKRKTKQKTKTKTKTKRRVSKRIKKGGASFTYIDWVKKDYNLECREGEGKCNLGRFFNTLLFKTDENSKIDFASIDAKDKDKYMTKDEFIKYLGEGKKYTDIANKPDEISLITEEKTKENIFNTIKNKASEHNVYFEILKFLELRDKRSTLKEEANINPKTIHWENNELLNEGIAVIDKIKQTAQTTTPSSTTSTTTTTTSTTPLTTTAASTAAPTTAAPTPTTTTTPQTTTTTTAMPPFSINCGENPIV